MIKKSNICTYISLFSCAGVGCYGFKEEGFECIATNEIIQRRLEIQRYNSKCRYPEGYIDGDIIQESTKERIYKEIERWQRLGNDGIDVLIATPPCQGISVINHKKNANDINRNSLVVESIQLVRTIKPKIFIFENVQGFQKTLCITPDEDILPIGMYIRKTLGSDYLITGRVINFMNYGSNSSRTRTLMIGVDKKYRNSIVPYDLFPDYQKEKTLRQVIGDFPPLAWGEISQDDFYHAFRTYDDKMRAWIHDLNEGESAFNNPDPQKRPHHIVDGEIKNNIQKNRDKYTRQKWDRFVQCVHTRNDQLAAQNTVHPCEDRVFSISELMDMMTIPKCFRWLPFSLEELNAMPIEDKLQLYRKNETNIRQCIGEAVPTRIMRQIAHKIKDLLYSLRQTPIEINDIITKRNLDSYPRLKEYLESNPDSLSISSLMRIAELCNSKREENEAYYTNKFMVGDVMSFLPDFQKTSIRILEPSVGIGNFLPFLFKRYEAVPHVDLDVMDIAQESIDNLKIFLRMIGVPQNFTIHFICDDFLLYDFKSRYDLIIGNPPYSKLKKITDGYRNLLKMNVNKKTKDISELFLEKSIRMASYVALVLNKTLLSTDEYSETRDLLRKLRIEAILDFGRYGFTGVSIETMCLMISPQSKPKDTIIYNLKFNLYRQVSQSYITDTRFPYFIVYRNEEFDIVADKMIFGIFDVFRDRQITKKNTIKERTDTSLRVIKARNISDDGEIIDISGYDTFIEADELKELTVSKYVGDTGVYLTPNMTYNPRVIRNNLGFVPDGSVAVLIPRTLFAISLSDEQLAFFATDEYRKFYAIARNLSTQSINIDKTSVFFFGVKK